MAEPADERCVSACLCNNQTKSPGSHTSGATVPGTANAINKHKGFQAIRRRCKLGFSVRRFRGREYLQEQAIADYRKVCEKYRKFLTRQQLINYGFSRLAGCLNRHGLTLQIAREKSGLSFDTPFYSRNKYTLANVVKAYKIYCKEHGYFLTCPQALTKMPAQMIGYIIRDIGFKKLRILTKLKF
jgi:hypothetical protein